MMLQSEDSHTGAKTPGMLIFTSTSIYNKGCPEIYLRTWAASTKSSARGPASGET